MKNILRKVLRIDIFQGKEREDDRKQDGKTPVKDTLKVLD